MLGAIIGGALSIGSAIANGISGNKARKAQRRALEQQKRENQAWYERKYNEDPLQRADAVRMLTLMNDQIRNRNKAARGRQAVMGGTDDSVTATREANAKTAADATAQIVANNDARKDNIEQQYLANKRSIENQEQQQRAQEAAAGASTIASVLSTASSIADTLDGGSKKAKTKTSSTGTSKGYVDSPTEASHTAAYSDDKLGKMGTSMA